MAHGLREAIKDAVDESKKKNKTEVDYSKGMKSKHCGICGHYRTPNKCIKVKGFIGEDMWCKLYESKAEEKKHD